MKNTRFMTFIKKPYVPVIVCALIISAWLTFWYGLRPEIVKNQCLVEADKRAHNDSFIQEVIYSHCLRTHGVKYTEE